MTPCRRIAVLAAAVLALLAAPYPLCLAGNAVWDLDQVVRTALANHPLVGQADAEILAAGARKGQAESAWYPSISLTGVYSRSRAFSPSSHLSSTTTSESLQGNLSQVLTDFGRTGSAVDRTDALLSSSRETGRSVREEVAFAAKVAYYNVLRARRIVEVSRETVKQRESLLRQAQAYYDAGIRARIDVARAEANLFQARAETTAAGNDLQVEQAALSVRAAVEKTGARRKEREASEENLRLATARYEVGAGDIIEMIDAQVQMTRSDTSMIEALYDSSVSIAALQRAIGK